MCKKILVIATVFMLGAASGQRLMGVYQHKLPIFVDDMVRNLESRQCENTGFSVLQDDFNRLKYEFTTTNDPLTIYKLSVHLAVDAFKFSHFNTATHRGR